MADGVMRLQLSRLMSHRACSSHRLAGWVLLCAQLQGCMTLLRSDDLLL